MLIQFKKDHIKSNFCRNKQMEIERNFLHVLMWYSYEKSISRKNIVLTPMLSREAIILQHHIIQFVLYMYLSEENSGKFQTVSYENRYNIR